MNTYPTGYYVTFKKRNSYFESYQDEQSVFCSRQILKEMIMKELTYHIISAKYGTYDGITPVIKKI